eukprot:14743-Rhodomonas_salina.1
MEVSERRGVEALIGDLDERLNRLECVLVGARDAKRESAAAIGEKDSETAKGEMSGAARRMAALCTSNRHVFQCHVRRAGQIRSRPGAAGAEPLLSQGRRRT